MSARTPPAPLPDDLEAGLKRLKLSTIRRQAPELLLTAKTQRWTPEETLRVLVELEIAARDESNCRHRMTAARFPVDKTLAEFNLDESSINPASHDYLITLDWIRRADNVCLVGPAGTGKNRLTTRPGSAVRADRQPEDACVDGVEAIPLHGRRGTERNDRTAAPNHEPERDRGAPNSIRHVCAVRRVRLKRTEQRTSMDLEVPRAQRRACGWTSRTYKPGRPSSSTGHLVHSDRGLSLREHVRRFLSRDQPMGAKTLDPSRARHRQGQRGGCCVVGKFHDRHDVEFSERVVEALRVPAERLGQLAGRSGTIRRSLDHSTPCV